MSEVIEGKIISVNLGEFSTKKIVYGYLGIELVDKKHIRVKIDSYTWYETLSLGDNVEVEFESLAGTDILVARRIRLKTSSDVSSDDAAAIA
ncbi:MAG: hypothetical protein ACFFBL_06590 [Promethearchaeota archaeon]